MAEILHFDGLRKRYAEQSATQPKCLKFHGNQFTRRRLFAAIVSATSLRSAARKMGGSDVLLAELQRYFERTPPDIPKAA